MITMDNMKGVTAGVEKYPKELRKNVRIVLNTEGFMIAKTKAQSMLPISSKSTAHARDANAIMKKGLKPKTGWQEGFYLTFYKKYWYLRFPNDGTVKQRPQRMLQRASNESIRPIQALVNKAIKSSDPF